MVQRVRVAVAVIDADRDRTVRRVRIFGCRGERDLAQRSGIVRSRCRTCQRHGLDAGNIGDVGGDPRWQGTGHGQHITGERIRQGDDGALDIAVVIVPDVQRGRGYRNRNGVLGVGCGERCPGCCGHGRVQKVCACAIDIGQGNVVLAVDEIRHVERAATQHHAGHDRRRRGQGRKDLDIAIGQDDLHTRQAVRVAHPRRGRFAGAVAGRDQQGFHSGGQICAFDLENAGVENGCAVHRQAQRVVDGGNVDHHPCRGRINAGGNVEKTGVRHVPGQVAVDERARLFA